MSDKGLKRQAYSACKNLTYAFTLAEVIVTLAIVGVLAAMTLPGLINSTNNSEYVARLKKFYATTNQALNQMATDYGCTGDLDCTGVFDASDLSKPGGGNYSSEYDKLGSIFTKYLNVAKICGDSTTGDCWSPRSCYNYDSSDCASFGATYNNYSFYYKFMTADGMSVALFSQGQCKHFDTDVSISGNGPLTQICGTVEVDLNGPKPPNSSGRDVFGFWITNGNGPMLYPFGGQDAAWDSGYPYWNQNPDAPACSPASTMGEYCASRIMDEGWQMNY